MEKPSETDGEHILYHIAVAREQVRKAVYAQNDDELMKALTSAARELRRAKIEIEDYL